MCGDGREEASTRDLEDKFNVSNCLCVSVKYIQEYKACCVFRAKNGCNHRHR